MHRGMLAAVLAIVLAGQGASLWLSHGAVAAEYPVTAAAIPAGGEGDVVLRDFRFKSGESLPELRIHYHAFGQPKRDSHGVVRNAVLIVHGTGGSGGSLIRPEFSGELFGPGQLLDASRYFIVL